MSWAEDHIAKLKGGQTVQFRPRGNSMKGLIESGQLVTVRPLTDQDLLVNQSYKEPKIVLCTVGKNDYLHVVCSATYKDWKNSEKNIIKEPTINDIQYLIRNNRIGRGRSRINGWTPRSKVYGICIKVED